jgi:hypothetical protein
LRASGCPGTLCITEQPEEGFLLLHRLLPVKVDVIDTPDKAFNVRRRRGTMNKLEKRLAGQSPFSDKVLQR